MASVTRTLHVGGTSNLQRHVWEHKTHAREGCTKDDEVTKLAHIAGFARTNDAIAWDRLLKGTSRAKKTALIDERNPRWNDLVWS